MLNRQIRIRTTLLALVAVTALAVGLAGCVAPPAGSQSFSIEANYPKEGEWTLRNLGRRGVIELTAYAQVQDGSASVVAFKFGKQEFDVPKVVLSLADPACTGRYSFALSHDSGTRTSSIEYLGTKLPWDEPLRLRAEWRGDGLLILTINDAESKTVPFNGALRSLLVEVSRGSVRVENLTYRELPN